MTASGGHFFYNASPGPPWVRQLYHEICKNSTKQPLEGRARFESVARTDSFQPRTPELAVTTVWAGRIDDKHINTIVGGLGAGAGALAGARLGGGSERVAQWAAAAITGEYPRAWGAERERSSSTHATQVQFEEPCRCARQQYASKYRARARVELQTTRFRGQHARYSASIAISLGYRDIADWVWIRPLTPRMGHGQAPTAVYADGGIYATIPAT
eukprot:2624301-Pleurochrysis_carterae.AAC.1